MPEAYAHYERAVSALERIEGDHVPGGIDRVDLMLKTADAAYLDRRAAPIGRARPWCARASSTSRPIRDRAAVGYTMLGRNAWATGDAEGAFEAFSRAIELLPADPPSVELAGVMAEEARSLLLIAHDSEAEVAQPRSDLGSPSRRRARGRRATH